MNNPGEKIRLSLLKRQEAYKIFTERKAEFLILKEQVNKDIEDARSIYMSAMSQLPKSEFEK